MCIDQDNIDERSHQVRQMRNIFASATRVLIWLGPGNRRLNEAMDALSNYTDAQCMEGYDRECLSQAFEDLFTKPWWSRVWTVQELLAAAREPLVGCGRRWISWSCFDWALSQMSKRQDRTHDGPAGLGIGSEWLILDTARREALTKLRKVYLKIKAGKKPTFSELLLAANTRGASDLRDRIFALIGLISNSENEYLEPNYGLDIATVYSNATIALFFDGCALEPLVSSSTWFRRHGLPTWCIDFSDIKSFDAAKWQYHFPGFLTSRDRSRPAISASASNPFNLLRYTASSGELVVEGCMVGKVGKVLQCGFDFHGDPFERRQYYHADYRQWLSSWSIFSERISSIMWWLFPTKFATKDTESLPPDTIDCVTLKALLEILSGGYLANSFTVSPRSEKYEQYRERNAVYSSMDSSVLYFVEKWLTDDFECESSRYQAICQIVEHMPRKAMFFGTDNGYIGRAHSEISSGDVVCLLFGCRLPVVLRKAGRNCYTFVTTAYVHGIMQGQLVANEAAVKKRRFHLI